MDRISISDLGVLRFISSGSFAEVCQCEVEGKKYAFKKFFEPEKIIDKDFLNKMENLGKLHLCKSAVPKILVTDDINDVGYLTELLVGKDYILLEELSEKIDALKETKTAIYELHNNKIIHTDIHGCNIFILKDGSSKLLDFDNASYLRKKPNKENYSDFAFNFVKKYGLSNKLDIYLFNLLTFASLNNCKLEEVAKLIFCGEYGVFNTKEAKKICDSLTLEKIKFNSDYLIDAVCLEEVEKIYQLKKALY